MRIRINDSIYCDGRYDSDRIDDLKRLQEMMENLGFPRIPLNELEDMWDKISDDYSAQWLGIPTDEDRLYDYLESVAIREWR